MVDQQSSTSTPSTSTPLRRPNTYPKVLSLGRGRGKFPLAYCTSMTKGCGCRLPSKHDIPQAPPVHQEPMVERNLAIVAPMKAPSKSRKDLANWSWVRLGNTRARHTNNNNNSMEQRQWQRPDHNNNHRTLDETEDHANANSIEEDAIHSEEERPGFEDLK